MKSYFVRGEVVKDGKQISEFSGFVHCPRFSSSRKVIEEVYKHMIEDTAIKSNVAIRDKHINFKQFNRV